MQYFKEVKVMKIKKKRGDSKLVVRGFLRGQLVDGKTRKVVGDSGWVQNKVMNNGLADLALLLGAQANSYTLGYAVLGTQTAAPDMTQTALIGSVNSYRALNLSTSGTCTLVCTASFSSSDLGASCVVGGAGLFKTNSAASMFACQTFTTSNWASNQDFNLTYQIRFATA
jgi:hypothetical protein